MRLLFLNALKGLRKKKIQMFGIIFMVLLSTAVYTGMNSAIDRLENKYYTYLDEQNVEDLSLALNIDFTKDIKSEDLDYILENYMKDSSAEEKFIIEQYRAFLNNPYYDINMIYTVRSLLNKYDALSYIEEKTLDSIKENYDFSYERELSKTVSDGKKLYKFISYDENKKINVPYLIEGNMPKNKNEITLLPAFAKKNNVKIGDNYKVGDKTYKVVGFAYAPDYIYPLISFNMPIFDERNNCVIYINQASYDEVSGIYDNSYAIKYNFEVNRKFELNVEVNEDGKTQTNNDPMLKILDNEKVTMDLNTITRIARIGSLQLEFASDRLFAKYFLYLLLSISVLIILVITKKRIDDERLQIGVLKSLGYNRFSIAISYLVYPVVGSLIGGVLGYFVGILVHEPIATILRSYFAVPLSNYKINFEYLKTSVFVPMITLSVLSYLIALLMLRKKPLQLLKEGSNLRVNLFNKLLNKITKLLPFNLRFKYSLAFRSIGKLFIVTITAFSTGLLITLILIGSNLFNNVIDKSFSGVNYKYIAQSTSIYQFNEKDNQSDYILNVSLPINKVVDSQGNEKKLKGDNHDVSLTVNGIDLDAKYTQINDKNDKNIINKLSDENGLIISENAKDVLGLDLNDTITLKYEDLEIEYKIIGFSAEYMSFSSYANRIGLSKKIGVDENTYSLIYSNNPKYESLDKLSDEEARSISYLLNVDDLKENIEKQMDRFNGSIYIVIGFASVMALIIIAVIANIIVEENKKTISLMKVMGYDNKRISSIVLNIYTPFIVIAYLISIPVMIKLLKAIVAALVGDIEITIPIEADPVMSILGLIGLLVAYYIALGMSKKVLNKIPLAVALKRE